MLSFGRARSGEESLLDLRRDAGSPPAEPPQSSRLWCAMISAGAAILHLARRGEASSMDPARLQVVREACIMVPYYYDMLLLENDTCSPRTCFAGNRRSTVDGQSTHCCKKWDFVDCEGDGCWNTPDFTSYLHLDNQRDNLIDSNSFLLL